MRLTEEKERVSSYIKVMTRKHLRLLLIAMILVSGCEYETKVKVSQRQPNAFYLSGSGKLLDLKVLGPKVREANNEDAFIIWEIVPVGSNDKAINYKSARFVEDIDPITYGVVPEGYIQVYPQNSPAPALSEKEEYRLVINTMGAPGADIKFKFNNGKFFLAP